EYFRNIPFDRVVVSPLSRAMDTAILAAGKNRDVFEPEKKLMEQNFGIFEGKTFEELTLEYPEEMKRWQEDYFHYRIPGGESFSDVRERVEDWTATLSEEPGQMLVVAHKGTLGHMMAAFLHLPLEGYWNFVFDQGCYSCVDLEDGFAIIRKLNQSVIPE
ncbi:MAG: histidine phosphatase family protein, partial [Eubacterium sp.]|nr:histidine phosphatase family protein [Eubacterium sp.]